MSYKRAESILPAEIIELIQQYVEGESIYIPRKTGARKNWGQETQTRQELNERNLLIFADYRKGLRTTELAGKYYLSIKSIQRIIREMKNVK